MWINTLKLKFITFKHQIVLVNQRHHMSITIADPFKIHIKIEAVL